VPIFLVKVLATDPDLRSPREEGEADEGVEGRPVGPEHLQVDEDVAGWQVWQSEKSVQTDQVRKECEERNWAKLERRR